MEARFIKEKLEALTGQSLFLDSDDLYDLGSLLDRVRRLLKLALCGIDSFIHSFFGIGHTASHRCARATR